MLNVGAAAMRRCSRGNLPTAGDEDKTRVVALGNLNCTNFHLRKNASDCSKCGILAYIIAGVAVAAVATGACLLR